MKVLQWKTQNGVFLYSNCKLKVNHDKATKAINCMASDKECDSYFYPFHRPWDDQGFHAYHLWLISPPSCTSRVNEITESRIICSGITETCWCNQLQLLTEQISICLEKLSGNRAIADKLYIHTHAHTSLSVPIYNKTFQGLVARYKVWKKCEWINILNNILNVSHLWLIYSFM